METKLVKMNSANITVDNSNDAQKQYNLQADVEVYDKVVARFLNGLVMKNNKVMAKFSVYGNNEFNIVYKEVDPAEQLTINTEVNDFITSAKATIASATFNF